TLPELYRLSRESSRIQRRSDVLPMKTLISLLLLIPLCAQEPAKPAADPAPAVQDQAAKPAQGQAKPAEPAAPADETPPGESLLRGSFEVAYRCISYSNVSLNTYRSVVNLGEGSKLLDADFTLTNISKRFFDRADVHASSWGGDPYNTLRVDEQKA